MEGTLSGGKKWSEGSYTLPSLKTGTYDIPINTDFDVNDIVLDFPTLLVSVQYNVRSSKDVQLRDKQPFGRKLMYNSDFSGGFYYQIIEVTRTYIRLVVQVGSNSLASTPLTWTAYE